jgi:hypothetical protein
MSFADGPAVMAPDALTLMLPDVVTVFSKSTLGTPLMLMLPSAASAPSTARTPPPAMLRVPEVVVMGPLSVSVPG